MTEQKQHQTEQTAEQAADQAAREFNEFMLEPIEDTPEAREAAEGIKEWLVRFRS